MKFSIRDLFLVTVIVALAATLAVERSRLRGENGRLILENADLRKGIRDEHNHRLEASSEAAIHRGIHAELLHENYLLKKNTSPNSSAPAPNPPKP